MECVLETARCFDILAAWVKGSHPDAPAFLPATVMMQPALARLIASSN